MPAALKTKTRPRPAEKKPVRELRERFGISQSLLARLLDTSVRTVSALESARDLTPRARRNFAQLSRLCNTLKHIMHADFVGTWLDHPNEMLGGLKPVEAIERGQIDLLWQEVEGLKSPMQG